MIVLFLLLLVPTENQSLIVNANYATLTISCNSEGNSPQLWIIMSQRFEYLRQASMCNYYNFQRWHYGSVTHSISMLSCQAHAIAELNSIEGLESPVINLSAQYHLEASLQCAWRLILVGQNSLHSYLCHTHIYCTPRGELKYSLNITNAQARGSNGHQIWVHAC